MKRYFINSKMAVLLCAILFLSGCLLLSGKNKSIEESSVERDFFAMDTRFSFTAYGNGAKQALEQTEKRMIQLEQLWSVTNEDSEIYALNHSGGQTVNLSEDTAEIIKFALELSEKTGGALDPTIYPVLTAWGFTTGENRVPEETEIELLLNRIGYEKVNLQDTQIKLPADFELDLGAVGKGWAGDEAAAILRDDGISSAILNLGGNIQAVGSRLDGSDWRLGIRSPYDEGSLGILEISNCAVVTSGNYERYFVDEAGKSYGHILDPNTGYPVENELVSMSVIAEEGKMADALSTALFVMGKQNAEQFWRENKDFEMLFVTADGTICLTEGIQDRFTLNQNFGNMKVQIIEN